MSEESFMHFPFVSSHIHGDEVKTTGLLVTSNGCSIVHCNTMPRNLRGPVHRAAPRIAAAHRSMLRKLGAQQTQRKVAEAFVTRARQGDQNAMAMMAMVRDTAQKGSPQAALSLKFMQDFVKAHPVTADSPFGVEECKCIAPDAVSAVSLANGPPVTKRRVQKVLASFGGEERELLLEGIQKWQASHDKAHEKLNERLDNLQREVLRMGRTLGMARGIQIARHPNMPLKAFDPRIAWELGE